MLVPGMKHRFAVPSLFAPALAAFAAVLIGIGAWGFLSTRSNLTVQAPINMAANDTSHLTYVAYVVPGERQDVVYLRSREAGATPTHLIAFPSAFNLHARGTASPTGKTIGLVSVSGNSGAQASLTFITIPDQEITVAGSPFDLLTALTWSPDGAYVTGQLSGLPDSAGRVHVDIIRAEAATGATSTLASFDDVLLATPVGYSPDGARLFVVTVDQTGSWLWSMSAGAAPAKVGRLSTGGTRDWRLSPDATRLAFIESPVGDRSSAGRIFVMATGTVQTSPSTAEQIGASWRPGAVVPDFGGPGGSLQLDPPPVAGSYVIPISWSPDGEMLIANVLVPAADPADPFEQSVQLVTPTTRALLDEQPGTRFIGWVTDE